MTGDANLLQEQPPEGEPCQFVERCPMYPVFRSTAALKIYQTVYCYGAFTTCERFKLASTGTMPSPALLPDGKSMPAHWLDDAGAGLAPDVDDT